MRERIRQTEWRGFWVFAGLSVVLAVSGWAAPGPAGLILTAPSPHAKAQFGSAVAISADGQMLLVGAPGGEACPGKPGFTCGAVYVYTRSSGSGWTLASTLTPDDGGHPGFGFALALSPDASVLIVGGASESCADSPTVPCGLLYVFAHGTGGWTQEKKIVDPLISDQYKAGISLALSDGGATALVAGPPVPCAASFMYSDYSCRFAHVFIRDGGAWTLRTGFIPDGQTRSTFSLALSRDGSTGLIGISNTYCAASPCGSPLLVYSDLTATLSHGPSGRISPTVPAENLGFSISMSGNGDVVAAGDPDYACPKGTCSSGFLFRRTGSSWTEERKLPASGSPYSPEFGLRTALSQDGGTVVFEAQNPKCYACADVFLSRYGQGGWSDSIPLATSQAGAFPELTSPQPLAISGDGRIVLLGTPVTPCAGGDGCGTVHVLDTQAIDFSPAVPALGGPGLILFSLLLGGGGALLLRRRSRGLERA